MKKSLYLILIIVLCFSGCKNKKDQDQFIRPVKSSVVMQELPNVTEKLSGTIAASTESYPVFRVPGSVNGIFVKPGQYVKKGELIATIDPKEYEVTYAAAESKYKQVQDRKSVV